MVGKFKDSVRNTEKNCNQNSLDNIKTYFPRFSRKSHSGRYGAPLVMTKVPNVVDFDEPEENKMSENISETSKIEDAECSDSLNVVVGGENGVFVNTNGSETSVRSISEGRLSDSSESLEKGVHLFCELEQSNVFLPCMQEGEQTGWDKDSAFSAIKEGPGIESVQEIDFVCDTSISVPQEVEKLSSSLYNAYTKIDIPLEQEIVEDKQMDHEKLYDEIREGNEKEDLEVLVSISRDSPKDDQILREEICDRIVFDPNALAHNNSSDDKASQHKNIHSAQELCASLSAYPREENLLPLTLPDDFSDQERAYAVLSIKEWEDKGLEISKRGLQLIEKVILLRKRKEELLFQVQNMIDVHAEKLVQREESLRLRALDVKKRGKELLDGM
ncbi:hypothetical protein PMAC_002364 [Pneumocystis sp. 'macacae']|nr:hypothetical protein PMAC_002364 [Pneumocystis sp. 'macacae']